MLSRKLVWLFALLLMLAPAAALADCDDHDSCWHHHAHHCWTVHCHGHHHCCGHHRHHCEHEHGCSAFHFHCDSDCHHDSHAHCCSSGGEPACEATSKDRAPEQQPAACETHGEDCRDTYCQARWY
ncbi:MAG: hypothetical protein HY303_07495 [Candidatus Wallbacteria bacterium]|nr:hypothetical protein [Candidatus Wallbacteria bacterium]